MKKKYDKIEKKKKIRRCTYCTCDYRLVGLTLKFLTASSVALKHIQKRLVGQDLMKNNKGL